MHAAVIPVIVRPRVVMVLVMVQGTWAVAVAHLPPIQLVVAAVKWIVAAVAAILAQQLMAFADLIIRIILNPKETVL